MTITLKRQSLCIPVTITIRLQIDGMITLSCTSKVQTGLKKHKAIIPDKEDIGFYNWYVDQINIARKSYFLFTHSESLFSFFIYAGTKEELVNIEKLFEEKAKELILKELRISKELVAELFPKGSGYKFNKTNSRSVLGSMNDFKNIVKDRDWEKGEFMEKYDELIHWMNKAPMGALKYKNPKSKLKELLESRYQEKYN